MLGRHKKEAHPGGKANERVVFHIDMDAFFASVEVMCRPKLRGKPVIVCGKPTTRSVAAAASYEAREYGIRSGMSTVECFRRCPHVVAVEGNPGQYIYVSLELLRTYKEFSTIVEPYSIDEAFVEMTGTECTWENCEEVAGRIKERMHERFPDLTASIGVGHVMRCMALAQAWQDVGGKTFFVCSGLPDTLRKNLDSEGISVLEIDAERGSEEDARANEQSGYYQEQVGRFKDFFTAPPVQEGYEVVVQA